MSIKLSDRVIKFVNNLFESKERFDKYSKMSNDEIAQLLLNEVWPKLEIYTEESDIVDMAIERLRSNEKNIE